MQRISQESVDKLNFSVLAFSLVKRDQLRFQSFDVRFVAACVCGNGRVKITSERESENTSGVLCRTDPIVSFSRA